MSTFQHPASLNPLQQYGQACSILANTTRASNHAWYQDALDLNFQLHIRPEGPCISCFYFDRKKDQWSPGPALTDEILGDSAKLDAFIAEALRVTRSHGAKALGVILHIADDFAITELKPEFDNPASLPDLRDAAIFDPASILEDSSILKDQASWRVLPYPAAGSEVIGTTVTLTRQYAPLISTFRETSERQNFPIITHALSAPLVAIMGLGDSLVPTPDKPFVAILQYPWFTTLAFFNEHADLRLIRTLHHRGVRRAGTLRNALFTTNASLEFIDPDIFVVPLGQDVDSKLEANLRTTYPTCRVETLGMTLPEGTPAWCPEPSISVKPSAKPNPSALASHTFSILRDEKWALQNFLPIPKEIEEIYPSRSEMRLLSMLRLSRVVLFAITILCIAYLSLGIVEMLRQREWAFDVKETDIIKVNLAKLNAERQKSEHWDNLLQDRSKAWAAMESLSQMFPENGGMLVKNYSHICKPESAPGRAKVGFVKEWKMNGYAREEAYEYLNTLNTREGINSHFAKIARVTANPAYNPSIGNRSISVNVRTQENVRFKASPAEEINNSDESTYPYSFDLTITQRFEASDPMAINVSKMP